MKQVASEKYNIAWFKIAECVARGEKERALGVYRLLAHSLDDPALKCQLEGDILLSFDDADSEKKYSEAAELYEQNGRTLEAVAVYEHLLTLRPTTINYLRNLIILYKQLNFIDHAIARIVDAAELLIARGDYAHVAEWVDELETLGAYAYAGNIQVKLATVFIKKKTSKPEIKAYIERAIDFFLRGNEHALAQQFFTELDSADHAWYEHAVHYYEQRNKNKSKR